MPLPAAQLRPDHSSRGRGRRNAAPTGTTASAAPTGANERRKAATPPSPPPPQPPLPFAVGVAFGRHRPPADLLHAARLPRSLQRRGELRLAVRGLAVEHRARGGLERAADRGPLEAGGEQVV